MKDNKLVIRINKPISDVFAFTITPPNTTLWIKSIVKEETSEWPIRVGTVYKLTDRNGRPSEVTVTSFKKNKLVEWISQDGNYHCRYTYRLLSKQTTELEYYEWVNTGELDEPFTQETLGKLKLVLENRKV